MLLKKWEEFPENLKTDAVYEYYKILSKKKLGIVFKRFFDVVVSSVLLVLLSPVFLFLAIAIKVESEGPVFYRQVRVTQYGEQFKVFKFRTMVANADKIGTLITLDNDLRITKVGKFIRKFRLDEISQLIDVFRGKMTFVGTRPEVPKYVEQYTDEMLATLLLPAGVTSMASIYYKDEGELLDDSTDPEETYVNDILPAKMYYNLKAIKEFGFFKDVKIMFMTVLAVLGKEYVDEIVYKSRESTEKVEV